MKEETTDILIKRVFEYVKKPATISFTFQGGEPTMAGISYFQHFVEKVNEFNTDNFTIQYSIQTNGYLIDESYCELFQKYKFLVGISLDGPRDIHDINRVDANLTGTFDRVNKAIKLLEQYQVDYNILSVITKQLAKKPQSLFHFYQKKKFGYVQLIKLSYIKSVTPFTFACSSSSIGMIIHFFPSMICDLI